MWVLIALVLTTTAPPSAGEPTLNVAQADIAQVLWSADGSVTVRLAPRASTEFEKFTRDNLGKMVSVTMDAIPAVRAVVQGVITSGALGIDAPSATLRALLERVSARNSGAADRTGHGQHDYCHLPERLRSFEYLTPGDTSVG